MPLCWIGLCSTAVPEPLFDNEGKRQGVGTS